MKLRIVSSFLLCNPDDGYAGKRLPPPGQRRPTWEGEITLPPGDPDTDTINEYIFHRFNAVNEGDRERMLEIGYDLPSLSPGDIVVWLPRSEQDTTRPRMFMVNGVGFAEVFPGMGILGSAVSR